jgi:hypothetical protein
MPQHPDPEPGAALQGRAHAPPVLLLGPTGRFGPPPGRAADEIADSATVTRAVPGRWLSKASLIQAHLGR